MKKIYHYGCSFVENFRNYTTTKNLLKNYPYTNYGKSSAGNGYILDKFKETAKPNSLVWLQWSALTRPSYESISSHDENITKSNNPLFDLLENFYSRSMDAQEFANENNIKLFQYFGWAMWKDNELDDYHRNRLKSLNITWFRSDKMWDKISSNCWQLHSPSEWSLELFRDLFAWEDLIWGGMSEWVRQNVPENLRYYRVKNRFDPHPSEIATMSFLQNVLLKTIEVNNDY